MIRALRWSDREDGSVTVFTVVVVSALLLFAGLAGDGGAALAAKVRALHEASEAARAGAEQLDPTLFHRTGARVLDQSAAAAAARKYLAATDDVGTVSARADAVSVTVTAHHRTWLLNLIGIDTMTVHAAATAHPESANP